MMRSRSVLFAVAGLAAVLCLATCAPSLCPPPAPGVNTQCLVQVRVVHVPVLDAGTAQTDMVPGMDGPESGTGLGVETGRIFQAEKGRKSGPFSRPF